MMTNWAYDLPHMDVHYIWRIFVWRCGLCTYLFSTKLDVKMTWTTPTYMTRNKPTHVGSSDHFSYQKHKCTSIHKKDVQVPACPLCGEPVPTPRGVSPDMTVGQHIDQYCKSDKTKIFTNKCSFRGCKKKELVPIQCGACSLNFCLRHRHVTDHECNPSAARNTLAA